LINLFHKKYINIKYININNKLLIAFNLIMRQFFMAHPSTFNDNLI